MVFINPFSFKNICLKYLAAFLYFVIEILSVWANFFYVFWGMWLKTELKKKTEFMEFHSRFNSYDFEINAPIPIDFSVRVWPKLSIYAKKKLLIVMKEDFCEPLATITPRISTLQHL